MEASQQLTDGVPATATLPQGRIHYRESGSGEPIVFMHGLLVNGLLWRKVVPLLEADFRCIVPDLPLGSHPEPMLADADLSPPGLAGIVDRFIESLGLERVTLVANDTGGAIAQITAANHPERIGRLVLTNCDAFENFLPPAFRPLQWTARVPGLLTVALQGMRLDLLRRRSPMAFGWLIKHDLKAAPLDEWMRPFLSNRGIRRDTVKVLRGIHPRYTIEAAERLQSADRPTLIAWAEEDRFFKIAFAERLAASIPGARLERIPDSYTFVSEDQPERLAELIASFSREPKPTPA
jgi:pimeloyl-ACP methyl ester carboxylesterase